VAAIGDSITAGSPWDDDAAVGWPAAAAAADPRLRFTVRAVYGKRTDEIAGWLDEAAAGAEALVVQGGINDIAQGRPVADAAANRLRHDPPRAGARTACGRRHCPSLEQRLAPGRGCDPRVERVDRGNGRAGLPFHETLEDPERPGRMREDWTIEGDHPSVEGYRRLGELAFRLP
jgi:lysophospholipase L1-like esterase